MRSNRSDETHRSCGDGQDKSISGSFDNTTFAGTASSAKSTSRLVEQSTMFDVVIDMKTANALGIAVPPTPWHEAQRDHDNRNQADRFEQHCFSLEPIYRNTTAICRILTTCPVMLGL